MSWAVTGGQRIGTIASDDRFGAELTSTAEIDATFGNLLNESIVLSGAAFFPSDEEERSGQGVSAHTLDSIEDADDSRKDAYHYGSLSEAKLNGWYSKYKAIGLFRKESHSQKVIDYSPHSKESYSREIIDYSPLEQAQVNERDEGRPGLV